MERKVKKNVYLLNKRKDNLWWKGKWRRNYDERKEYTIKRWRRRHFGLEMKINKKIF